MQGFGWCLHFEMITLDETWKLTQVQECKGRHQLGDHRPQPRNEVMAPWTKEGGERMERSV